MDWSITAGRGHTSIGMAVSFYWDHSHFRDRARGWQCNSFRYSIVIPKKQEAFYREQVFIVVVKAWTDTGNTVGHSIVYYQCNSIITRSDIWVEIAVIASRPYQCMDISYKSRSPGKEDCCQVSCDHLDHSMDKHHILWKASRILTSGYDSNIFIVYRRYLVSRRGEKTKAKW